MNRDSGKLNNGDIWLDRRELIRVASGSGGYDGDRWYSGGGLLEVGGYLGTMGVPVSHWLAQGGQVRFEGAEVVTQKGSSINLSGGTLDVRAGTLQQTWLRGADGRLYVADKAPGDVLYTGVYQGYEQRSARWGERPRAASPRCWRRAPATRTATRSAATPARCSSRPAAPCWKAIWSATPTRARARTARRSPGWTATASRSAPPRRAGLVVGNDVRYYDTASRQIYSQLGATGDTVAEVVLGAGRERVADGLDLGAALPQENKGKLFLDANQLNGFSLGRLRVAAGRSITVDAALRGADGGEITLYAPDVDIKANLTSRGGLIQAGNVLYQPSFLAVRLEDSALAPAANQQARLRRGRRDAGRARRLGQSAAGRRRPGRPAGARRRPHRAARHR